MVWWEEGEEGGLRGGDPQSGFPDREFIGLNSRMSSLVPSYAL
jgi:hypothetical protein